jgi:hypothetical protein
MILVCTTPSTLAIWLRIALSPSIHAVKLGHDLLVGQRDDIGELQFFIFIAWRF